MRSASTIKDWLANNPATPALEDADVNEIAAPVAEVAVVAAAPEIEAALEVPPEVKTDVVEPTVEVTGTTSDTPAADVVSVETEELPVITADTDVVVAPVVGDVVITNTDTQVSSTPAPAEDAPTVADPAPATDVAQSPEVEIPVGTSETPALEEADLPPLTDGELKLEVITASEPSVDEVVGDMAESQVKSEEIQRDCDALVEGQSAMEAYMDILDRALEDGGLHQQAAAVMRVGLERYEDMFGLDKQLTPSVEAFGGSMSQRAATTVSMEEISAQLKKAWEVIKAALKQLWAQIQDVYAKIVLGVSAVEKRGNALVVKAKQVGNLKPANDKIKITSPGKLFADGTWYGDKEGVAALAGLVAYVSDKYPSSVAKYVSDLVSAMNEVKPQGLTLESVAMLVNDSAALVTAFPGKQVTDGSPLAVVGAAVYATDVLFGNQALVLTVAAKGKPGTVLTSITVANVAGKAAPAEYEVTVAPAKELGLRANELTRIAAKLGDLSKHQSEAKSAIDKLIAAGDALKARVDKEDLTAEQRRAANYALTAVTTVQKLLGTSYNGVLAYCVRTIAAQLAVVERQLAEYKAPAAETK